MLNVKRGRDGTRHRVKEEREEDERRDTYTFQPFQAL